MENINCKEMVEFINANSILKNSFISVLENKFSRDGYVNINKFLKYNTWNYPSNLDISKNKYLKYIDDLKNSQVRSLDTSKVIDKTVNYYLYNNYSNEEHFEEINKKIKELFLEFLKQKDVSINIFENRSVNGDFCYLYEPNIVHMNTIDSFEKYANFISSLKHKNNVSLFFRGQSDSNHVLLPSIYRSANWYNHEQYFYQQILRLCPKDFSGLKKHIDYLVEMQHYSAPTRCLDVSKSALVALYFACETMSNKANKYTDGEVIVFQENTNMIKFSYSDSVTILACLSKFSTEDKQAIYDLAENNIEKYNDMIKSAATHLKGTELSDYRIRTRQEIINDFNKDNVGLNYNDCVQRLLHEIKTEMPSFRNIIDPLKIENCIFTAPTLTNNRIIKQSGAFIIAGLLPFERSDILSKTLNEYRYTNHVGKKDIIIVPNKSKKILAESLEYCDINDSTLFPEIDKVSNYLKAKVGA